MKQSIILAGLLFLIMGCDTSTPLTETETSVGGHPLSRVSVPDDFNFNQMVEGEHFAVRVIQIDGAPAFNVEVTVADLNGFILKRSYTDSVGVFLFDVATAENLVAVTVEGSEKIEVVSVFSAGEILFVTSKQAAVVAAKSQVIAENPGYCRWNELGYTGKIAFEDNYPYLGDFDFNDVVAEFKVTESSGLEECKGSTQGYLAAITMEFRILALGAEYSNGFAVSLGDLPVPKSIEINGVAVSVDSTIIDGEVVLILSKYLLGEFKNLPAGARYINVGDLMGSRSATVAYEDLPVFTAKLTYDVLDRHSLKHMAAPYKPFVLQHGLMTNQIHFVGMEPVAGFNTDLFEQGDEGTLSGPYRTNFRTRGNYPWALIASSEWQIPEETISIVEATPDFKCWVESNGTDCRGWTAVGSFQKTYHPKGGLFNLSHQVDGVLNGEVLTYYETGELNIRSSFLRGRLSGEKSIYYKDGTIQERHSSYDANGKLNGTMSSYYENGTLSIEAHYSNSTLNGEWKMWNRDGVLISHKLYKNGKVVETYK